MELIRKDKEKFHSARKIPPSGKRPLMLKRRVETCRYDLSTNAAHKDKLLIF
jgi:hypothetical protein